MSDRRDPLVTAPTWKGRRPRVVLLGPQKRMATREEAAALRADVERHAEIVAADSDFALDLSQLEYDLVVVFGGDGSVLRSARRMADRQRPVLGVNLGRLGFLAALPPQELHSWFPKVAVGDCRIVHHLMFECTVIRDDQVIAHRMGLNEAAILGGPPYSILDVDLHVDGLWATTYSCDGLIIATPVGSTAHNLSAGGPILRKTIRAFVISAISPHTLTVRPVVDSADHVYEMSVRMPHEATSIVVDGKEVVQLEAHDRVRVVRAEPTFQLIEVETQNDYRTLREKLGWRGSLSAPPGG